MATLDKSAIAIASVESSASSIMAEVSLLEGLSKFLKNDALNDFALEGTDGVRVPANRYVLACRSQVFERMLLGQFAEAKKDVVKVGFQGNVLKAIVEYIHTDSAEILRLQKKRKEGNTGTTTTTAAGSSSKNGSPHHHQQHQPLYPYNVEQLQDLVSLAGAANYFYLPELSRKAQDCAAEYLKKTPSLALAVLEACQQAGPSVPQELEQLAMNQVRNIPKVCVIKDSIIACLSSTVLEMIVKDTDTSLDESQLFHILWLWVEHATNPESMDDRKAIASEFVKHIHLERIDPPFLFRTVELSGLVPTEQLMGVYRSQALAAHNHQALTVLRPRSHFPAVWKHSNSVQFSSTLTGSDRGDVLSCPPMMSGIHQWTYSWGTAGGCADVGVVLSHIHLDLEEDLAYQDGCWVYRSVDPTNGKTWHGGDVRKENLPAFKTGSKVTLTLNLLETDEGNGTLKASVDDGVTVELFSNLRQHLKNPSEGFLPAVSVYNPSAVSLTDIRRLA